MDFKHDFGDFDNDDANDDFDDFDDDVVKYDALLLALSQCRRASNI